MVDPVDSRAATATSVGTAELDRLATDGGGSVSAADNSVAGGFLQFRDLQNVVEKLEAVAGNSPAELPPADESDRLDGDADDSSGQPGSERRVPQDDGLRPIVIDGSNIAMSHGNKRCFSCRGIQIVVDWFRERGHRDITVFVPRWRRETHKHLGCPIADQEILLKLERERVVAFTPCRKIFGKRIACHDDLYIVKLASEIGGVIVSNDTYRELASKPEFGDVIANRLLMYTFVNDRFMPPDDPLGRSGPSLDSFLKFEPDPPVPPCPYPRCTFGAKCRYYHPERPAHQQRVNRTSTEGESSSENPNTGTHNSQGRAPGRGFGARRSDPVVQPTRGHHAHDTLRPVQSDPVENPSSVLEMAGKLSAAYKGIGNGAGGLSATWSSDLSSACSWDSVLSSSDWSASSSGVMSESDTSDTSNRHRRLERQLTLLDHQDPRLATMNAAVGQPAPEAALDSVNRDAVHKSTTVPTISTPCSQQQHQLRSLSLDGVTGGTSAVSEFQSTLASNCRKSPSYNQHPAASNLVPPGHPCDQQWQQFCSPVVGPVIFREPPSGSRPVLQASAAGYPPQQSYFVTQFNPLTYPPPPLLPSQNNSSSVNLPGGQLQMPMMAPLNFSLAPPVHFPHAISPPLLTHSTAQNYEHPNHPRHSIYVWLCGGFPADKVCSVLDKFPHETNPQNLCKHLLSMSDC